MYSDELDSGDYTIVCTLVCTLVCTIFVFRVWRTPASQYIVESDLKCIHKLLHMCEYEKVQVPIANYREKARDNRQSRQFATCKKKNVIAAEFEILQSTLSTILKNKNSHGLRANHAAGSEMKKHRGDPTRLEVDAALVQWKLYS